MAFRHARNCGKCGRYIKSCWCSFYPEKGYHDEGLCDECYEQDTLRQWSRPEAREGDNQWKPVRTRKNAVTELHGEWPDVCQDAVEVIAEAVHYRAQLDEEDEILGNARS